MRYLTISGGVLQIRDNPAGQLSLDQLYALTDGGPIEAPLAKRGLTLYCNEEGKLKNLAANVYSDELQDLIVGDVVIVAEKRGEQVEMTDAQMGYVRLVNAAEPETPVVLFQPGQSPLLGLARSIPRLEIR